MSVKVYENGWRDINNLKRYENGWVNCQFARKYENGQWVDVWTGPQNTWTGPYYDIPFSDKNNVYPRKAFYANGILYIEFNGNGVYKYDGSWTQIIPYDGTYLNSCFMINGEFYVLNTYDYYKYVNGTWTKWSTHTYNERAISRLPVYYNGNIFYIGYRAGYSPRYFYIYYWSGAQGTNCSNRLSTNGFLNNEYNYEPAICELNGAIYVFMDKAGGNIYRLDGSTLNIVGTMPCDVVNTNIVVYNGTFHMVGEDKNHYRWNGSSWDIITTLPSNARTDLSSSLVVIGNKLHYFALTYVAEGYRYPTSRYIFY